MGTTAKAMIKPASGVMCKFQTGLSFGLALLGLFVGALLAAGLAFGANGIYETWSSDSFTLTPRESFQIKVTYDQIQVRNWKLVVDGGDQNCDVHVRRTKDGSLLYQQSDQRHHDVPVPWGLGEEVSVVITNRNAKGAFVVSLMGPPRDQIHASYSYHVNRALDKFSSGQRLAAEAECRNALLENSEDGVAKVLLAGFLRDRQYFDRATGLVNEALEGDLPDNMRTIAESMRQELIKLRAPLPVPVRRGVEEAEGLLIDEESKKALALTEKLLNGDLELDSNSRSRILMLKGQALDQLGRNFESLDAFTNALQLNRNKDAEGVIYFHMGRLFLKMNNLPQAEGAYTMALENGLPSGLDVQAREALQGITRRTHDNR